MLKGIVLVVCCCLLLTASTSLKLKKKLQTEFQYKTKVKTWIYFTDKRNSKTSVSLHPKTLENRRNLGITEQDEYDLPVSQIYKEEILKISTEKNFGESRWLNGMSIYLTQKEAEEISKLSFVSHLDIVRSWKKKENPKTEFETKRIEETKQNLADGDRFNYGNSYASLKQINVVELHNLGITGEGVRVLVIDSGFKTAHPCLSKVKIQDTYDFIHNRTEVDNHPSDVFPQYFHGTYCLSLLSGQDQGNFFGVAPNATYILAKTEDLRSETRVEEDNFIRAIEWGESKGAQIVSSSLGYNAWYDHSDLDGVKPPITRSTCVIANGNEGEQGIGAPADAFYSLSIGAVDANGNIAFFSSRGPTADGRIKPEVCALGLNNHLPNVETGSGYTSGSGTSFATPIVAGVVTLIKSAKPTWSPYQIYFALTSTASKNTKPDNIYGYGIIDAMKALNASLHNEFGCHQNCNNQGGCYKDVCHCYEGFYGIGCELKKRECKIAVDVCEQGTCVNNTCVCNEGYTGITCKFLIEKPFNSNWVYGALFMTGASFIIISIFFWTVVGLFVHNFLKSRKKPIVLGDISHIELEGDPDEDVQYYSNLREVEDDDE